MPESPLDPSEETKKKIEERAYYMWEQDGRPQGRENDYWERASELQGIADSAGSGQLRNPATYRDPLLADIVVEESSIQENLGELPHANLSDQGDREETPRRKKRV